VSRSTPESIDVRSVLQQHLEPTMTTPSVPSTRPASSDADGDQPSRRPTAMPHPSSCPHFVQQHKAHRNLLIQQAERSEEQERTDTAGASSIGSC